MVMHARLTQAPLPPGTVDKAFAQPYCNETRPETLTEALARPDVYLWQ